jgi:hypothetical protein
LTEVTGAVYPTGNTNLGSVWEKADQHKRRNGSKRKIFFIRLR